MSNQNLSASDPMPFRSPINVTVPMSVAADLDQMNGVVKEVMRQVGCPTCHSGRDIRFNVTSDFVVNAAGDVAPAVGQGFGG